MIKKLFLGIILITIVTAGLACSTRQSLPLDDKTWLSPGKIEVSNFQPGKSTSQKITLHNGSKATVQYTMYYRTPDYVEQGFDAAPIDAQSWVTIIDQNPVLTSGETREIMVTLKLPSEAKTMSHWEFWIGVRAAKETGLTAELCSRWLISMGEN